MAETLNMREASLTQIQEFIKELFDMEIYDPVIVLGKMGMGKTVSLKTLAKTMGIGYCELRLVNMTETDMLGIPTINMDGATTYASNDLLPRVERDGERGILAIDEITSCSPTMRAAAYQLLDSQRALGNYKLPDKWICVGLGNGPDDGGVFNGAEAALFTRCYGFRVSPDITAWSDYAIQNDFNPTVIAYLKFDSEKLHVYDPDELDGLCPVPRTWEKLSKLLNAKEKYNNGKPLPLDMVEFLASAAIGVREAGFFSGFYKYNQSIVNPENILSGKSDGKCVANLEPEVVYIIIQKTISQLKIAMEKNPKKGGKFNDEIVEIVANIMNWFISAAMIKLDYGMMGIRDVFNNVEDIVDIIIMDPRFDALSPGFLKFATDNEIVTSAQ